MTNETTAPLENEAEDINAEEQSSVDNDNVEGSDSSMEGSDSSMEDKARRMGWIPKEEYRGPAENWVDAESFYNKGLEDLPIMRERYKTLERNFDRFERESTQALKDLKEHSARVEKQAYKQAMKELLKEQKEAVSDGDTERFEQLEREKEELQQSNVKPEAAPSSNQNEVDPYEQRVIEDWMAKESWYNADPQLQAAANAYHASISQSQPGLSLIESLEQVSSGIREAFPKKFGINPKRKAPPSVEGVNQISRKKAPAKSYQNLPPEAKAACDRMVGRGEVTQADYVKYYEWN